MYYIRILVSRRRGNVVKEVEKLKKNREERRQKQAEKKEEKEALMNIDPGNPRWEFLAMIRYHCPTFLVAILVHVVHSIGQIKKD